MFRISHRKHCLPLTNNISPNTKSFVSWIYIHVSAHIPKTWFEIPLIDVFHYLFIWRHGLRNSKYIENYDSKSSSAYFNLETLLKVDSSTIVFSFTSGVSNNSFLICHVEFIKMKVSLFIRCTEVAARILNFTPGLKSKAHSRNFIVETFNEIFYTRLPSRLWSENCPYIWLVIVYASYLLTLYEGFPDIVWASHLLIIFSMKI